MTEYRFSVKVLRAVQAKIQRMQRACVLVRKKSHRRAHVGLRIPANI